MYSSFSAVGTPLANKTVGTFPSDSILNIELTAFRQRSSPAAALKTPEVVERKIDSFSEDKPSISLPMIREAATKPKLDDKSVESHNVDQKKLPLTSQSPEKEKSTQNIENPFLNMILGSSSGSSRSKPVLQSTSTFQASSTQFSPTSRSSHPLRQSSSQQLVEQTSTSLLESAFQNITKKKMLADKDKEQDEQKKKHVTFKLTKENESIIDARIKPQSTTSTKKASIQDERSVKSKFLESLGRMEEDKDNQDFIPKKKTREEMENSSFIKQADQPQEKILPKDRKRPMIKDKEEPQPSQTRKKSEEPEKQPKNAKDVESKPQNPSSKHSSTREFFPVLCKGENYVAGKVVLSCHSFRNSFRNGKSHLIFFIAQGSPHITIGPASNPSIKPQLHSMLVVPPYEQFVLENYSDNEVCVLSYVRVKPSA